MSIQLPQQIIGRRQHSAHQLEAFRSALAKRNARSIIKQSAFVYATGSIARGDASPHSDLDAFVVSGDRAGKPLLSDLRTIELQAALIGAARDLGLPEFSDDGRFLKRHSLSEMLTKLGTAEDDYENLFTARILLLLESRPIIGDTQYDVAIEKILTEYWHDYAGHEDRFLPVYLTNDIIRYWKVLCLNYEANTRSGPDTKRRATNYKLKFSRLLTCYSALLYLCALTKEITSVSQTDARDMTRLSPLERLEAVARMCGSRKVDQQINALFDGYAAFLDVTARPKDELRQRFASDAYHIERLREAKAFGNTIFRLLEEIGRPTALYRYLVV